MRRAVSRGSRTDDGLAVAEGFHLLDEALASGVDIPVVLATPRAVDRLPRLGEATQLITVAERAFEAVADTESTQGVIALVRMREFAIGDVIGNLVVVLDGVQDPGNAGAIVRSAEAFGAAGVIGIEGTARFDHPKTLRAAAGSLFRVPHVGGATVDAAIAALRGVAVFAAMPAGPAAHAVDLTQACAIVIGGEGRGVGSAMRAAGTAVSIGTRNVESLNAAVAAAVLLYEASRQRSAR